MGIQLSFANKVSIKNRDVLSLSLSQLLKCIAVMYLEEVPEETRQPHLPMKVTNL